MLDDYKDKQLIAYNLLINEIESDHISHAYLIDENDNSQAFEIVMAFIKEILCKGLDSASACALCKRIDDGNYPEIKVIKPDGLLIKKQQILDLQKEFSMVAVEGNKRIYVIRDVDKMRNDTANSMLKFLEEPDNNIIAILMTNNFGNLLSTIVSRCQVIRLNCDTDCANDVELDNLALKFIKKLEFDGIKCFVDTHELLFDKINSKEREKFIYLFDKMIDMYYDILKILNGYKNVKLSNYYDELAALSKLNSTDKILTKIDILLEYKDTIKNNVNMSLLCDSLVARIGGMRDDSWR